MNLHVMDKAVGILNSLIPNVRLACAECRLLRTVLRESWEEPFKGTVSHLIVDFSSSFLLQDRLAVHKRVASSGHCGDVRQFSIQAGLVQVRDVVDDFWLLRISLCPDFVVGLIKFLEIGRQ